MRSRQIAHQTQSQGSKSSLFLRLVANHRVLLDVRDKDIIQRRLRRIFVVMHLDAVHGRVIGSMLGCSDRSVGNG